MTVQRTKLPVTVRRTKLAETLWRLGLTQVRACEITGVSRQTLSHAYAGRPVTDNVWIRLADRLNVSIAEIAPADVAAKIAAVA